MIDRKSAFEMDRASEFPSIPSTQVHLTRKRLVLQVKIDRNIKDYTHRDAFILTYLSYRSSVSLKFHILTRETERD